MPIDDLFQQVRSQCCDKIQNLYSKIQLLNLQQVDVDQLYVDVYVLKAISGVDFATIPDLLKNSDVPDKFDRWGLGQRGDRKDGFTVANDHRINRLMILGKPGSGKTTFLRHLAVACCQGEFQSDHIPILIELRSIENASQFNLLNIIHQELDLPDMEQTKQTLKQGKVLIFLDGLDEVPSESRRDVQNKIDKFSREAQYFKNQFIVTCRTQTTESNLQNFTYVEVADFKLQQVEKFAKNWFTTLKSEQGEELTTRFLEKLMLPENKQIADLAVTPILLSLTCWIFGESKDLPPKRSQLYQRGIGLLLKQWDEHRDIQRDVGGERYRNLSPEDKQKLLSYVANRKFNQEQYALFEESEIQKYIAEYLKDISTNESLEVLKAIEAQHGLLIKRAQGFDSAGIYSFSHLTFQEYFTAQYIIENKQIEQLVQKHLTDTRWREVFLLAAELMGENAGNLLSLMQEEAQKYINTPKLQALFNWADEITSGTGGDIQPVGKCAIAISVAYANANANAYRNAYANAYAMAIAIANAKPNAYGNDYAYGNGNGNVNANAYRNAYANAYAITYAYAYANAIANANAYAKAYAYVKANANANAYAIANAYTITNAYAIEKAIELTLQLEKLQIFNYEGFSQLAINLEKLKSQIPDQEQPREERKKFAAELLTTLLNAFNLTLEMIYFSKEELETLDKKYFYANKLIIDCKKAAIGEISPDWWQEIETRMLKPNL